jgi:hypothetical protein
MLIEQSPRASPIFIVKSTMQADDEVGVGINET